MYSCALCFIITSFSTWHLGKQWEQLRSRVQHFWRKDNIQIWKRLLRESRYFQSDKGIHNTMSFLTIWPPTCAAWTTCFSPGPSPCHNLYWHFQLGFYSWSWLPLPIPNVFLGHVPTLTMWIPPSYYPTLNADEHSREIEKLFKHKAWLLFPSNKVSHYCCLISIFNVLILWHLLSLSHFC